MLSVGKRVVVLGVHRSGTSAVAGVLHHLGVRMGERLLPPDEKNPRGYFEDLDFSDLHHKMLVNWFNPADAAEAYAEQYGKLIRSKSFQPLWGVKDPKLCLLMPYFIRHVRKPLLIDMNRCEEAVLASITSESFGRKSFPAAKGGWQDGRYTLEQATRLTRIYSRAKEDFLQSFGGPRLTVSYEELVARSNNTVRVIADFVGKSVTKEAVSFVDPALAHQTTSR